MVALALTLEPIPTCRLHLSAHPRAHQVDGDKGDYEYSYTYTYREGKSVAPLVENPPPPVARSHHAPLVPARSSPVAVPTRTRWQRREDCGPLLQAPGATSAASTTLAALASWRPTEALRGARHGTCAHAGRDRAGLPQQETPSGVSAGASEESAVVEGLSLSWLNVLPCCMPLSGFLEAPAAPVAPPPPPSPPGRARSASAAAFPPTDWIQLAQGGTAQAPAQSRDFVCPPIGPPTSTSTTMRTRRQRTRPRRRQQSRRDQPRHSSDQRRD